MCTILLGLVVNLPIPGGQVSVHINRVVHTLMDFSYLAQYECHTSNTISKLEDSLVQFHQNKDVFLDLGIWDGFRIPKLHSLSHYASSIQLFGTTDNYNTEQTEHLHIDFTKHTYCAMNHKDEFAQMTKWLEHRKKIQQHSESIEWRQQPVDLHSPSHNAIGPPHTCTLTLKMMQKPAMARVPFNALANDYGVLDFQDALVDFIAQVNFPGASGIALWHFAHDTHIPFSGIPVYHNIKFTKSSEFEGSKIVDVVHIWPEQLDSHGRIVPAHFDTVLVNGRGPNGRQGQSNKGESDLT